MYSLGIDSVDLIKKTEDKNCMNILNSNTNRKA